MLKRNFSVLLQKSVTALICQTTTGDASVLSRNPRSSIMICRRTNFRLFSELIGATLAMEDWLAQRLNEIEKNPGSRDTSDHAASFSVLLALCVLLG